MAKPHTYHMISFEDRPTTPPPLLSGSDTCRPSP